MLRHSFLSQVPETRDLMVRDTYFLVKRRLVRSNAWVRPQKGADRVGRTHMIGLRSK